MIQLYKKRDFGELFSDTFAFLKQNGKHFYKNYILINGAFILILMLMMYFFLKVYSSLVSASVSPIAGSSTAIENYFNENGLLVFLFFSVFALVALAVGFITYAYTPVYMLLYAKKGSSLFNGKDIVTMLKQNSGKLIIYVLVSLLVFLPVLFGTGIIAFILMVTIIGIFFLPLLMATITLFYNNSLLEYLNSNKGIFDCFGYGLQLTFKRFWVCTGCVALFYIMVQIVQGIATLVPYVAGVVSVVTTSSSLGSDPEDIATVFTILLVFYVFAFLLSLLGNTVVQINQGIVYFSLKEENENINTSSAIDQIGASGE